MEDKQIIDLYFDRDERAISETGKKYGAFCHRIAMNILCIREENPISLKVKPRVVLLLLLVYNAVTRAYILKCRLGKEVLAYTMKKIKEAESENGETLFDIRIDQILNKNDWYDHTLSFDKE